MRDGRLIRKHKHEGFIALVFAVAWYGWGGWKGEEDDGLAVS